MMTRKDYNKVGGILRKYKDTIPALEFNDLVDDFSFFFENDNRNFIPERFLELCNDSK